MQGQQQRSLQKAQAAHEVDMKGRREGIAVIARLGNGAAGLAQAGVVDGDAHQAARTIGQGAPPDAGEQGLRFPAAARVEEVLARPTALLAALRPDNARQDSVGPYRPARPRLGAWRDGRCAAGGNWESQSATISDQAGKRVIGPPGERRKCSWPVRRKRSPRATFLVREETRLSRSTETWKVEWMRSRISATCKGVRAFLSMSKAMSTWDRLARGRGAAGSGEPSRRRRTARSWASREASNMERMESLRSSDKHTSGAKAQEEDSKPCRSVNRNVDLPDLNVETPEPWVSPTANGVVPVRETW